MFCIKTQVKLSQFIETIARQEYQLEKQKQQLAQQQQFESYTVFKKLDKGTKGYINHQEIEQYLSTNGLKLPPKQIHTIFHYLDTNQDNKISYSEFRSQILPKHDTQLANKVFSRKPYKLDQQDPIPSQLQQPLVQLFYQIANKYQLVEKARQILFNCYDFSVKYVWDYVAPNSKKQVDSQDICLFLQKLDVRLNQQQLKCLLQEINSYDVDKIIEREFLTLFELSFIYQKDQQELKEELGQDQISDIQQNRSTREQNRKAIYQNNERQVKEKQQEKKDGNLQVLKKTLSIMLNDLLCQELQLQNQINILSMRSDFNFLDNFRFFDKKVKQFLQKSDLSDGLQDLGIKVDDDRIDLIFGVCDRHNKGFIRCSDFNVLFMAYDHKYRQLIQNRQPSVSVEIRPEFSQNTVQGIKKVMIGWLETLEQAKLVIQTKKDIELSSIVYNLGQKMNVDSEQQDYILGIYGLRQQQK